MTRFILSILFIILVGSSTYGTGNTWSQKNDIAYPVKDFSEPRLRRAAATFTIGGKGYLCGGSYSLGFSLIDAWAYDSLTGGWTQLADMPAVCGNGAAFAIGNKGYVGTGANQFAQPSNQFFEYDVASNTWSTKANFGGAARYGTVGFSVGTKGYIGLGGTSSTLFSDIWEYDPVSNAWTQKANFFGGARTDAVAFTIGTRAYVGTGNTASAYTKDLYEFNPATNTWTSRASLPSTASIRRGAVGFAIGSRGYITTGINPNAFYPYQYDCYEYNPTTNTWTTRPSFPGRGRVDGIAMAIGSRAYVGTGSDAAGNETGDMRCYDQNTSSWTSATPFGGVGGSAKNAVTIGANAYIGTGGLCDLRKYFPATDTWQSASFYIDTPRSGGVAFSIGSKG
ncbi:MAG: kelch repeat-containing protein, partial [Bacteroidota bacterium]